MKEALCTKEKELKEVKAELAESKENLELLMASASDVKQMLEDTLKVKLRYELIIKNLLENDKKEDKLPVVKVIAKTKIDEQTIIESEKEK